MRTGEGEGRTGAGEGEPGRKARSSREGGGSSGRSGKGALSGKTAHQTGFGPDGMAEWLRHETSEPGVLGSNPPQVSDCPTILLGLGGYPGRSL